MGGSSGSGSVGGGKGTSDSSFDQSVWGGQGDALKGLYDQAANLYGQSDFGGLNQAIGGLGGYNQNLMGQGSGGVGGQLGGGAFGDTGDVRSALMSSLAGTAGGSNTGRMYEDIVGGSGNTYIDPMVDAMKQGGMENLAMMQSNAGLDASAAGQGGSSRHAMQNAMLGRSVNQDMMNQETNMRGGAYDTDLNWKMDIAKQADQGIQNTQQQYMNMLGGANQSAQQGMGNLGGMQNLGMGSLSPILQGLQAPWNEMGNYSNTLGDPTVLGQGSSNSKNVGGNTSAGVGGKS